MSFLEIEGFAAPEQVEDLTEFAETLDDETRAAITNTLGKSTESVQASLSRASQSAAAASGAIEALNAKAQALDAQISETQTAIDATTVRNATNPSANLQTLLAVFNTRLAELQAQREEIVTDGLATTVETALAERDAYADAEVAINGFKGAFA